MNYAKNKLTPWFSAGVNPVRPGVYEREGFDVLKYSFWDGEFWMLSAATPEIAVRHGGSKSTCQKSAWRGLNFNPLEFAA